MFSQETQEKKDIDEEKEQLPEYKGLKSKDIEYYDKIKDILLSVGYFRIRISTLSPFDKCVGGLCWCKKINNK
jgi:hypothetical protein